MFRHLSWISLVAALTFCAPAAADDAQYDFGGDVFLTGKNPTVIEPVVHDAFVAGNTVILRATVAGDAHMAGYNVSSDAAIIGSLYAAGYTVTATAPIGADVTAIANTISLTSDTSVSGNARLAGATVSVAAPIAGSLLVTAQTLTLSAPVSGDLSIFGETVTFGPGAKVAGMVTIKAPKPIAVPASVASADRVTFELSDAPNSVTEAGKTANNALSGLWPELWVMAAWLALLFASGAAVITLLPRAVAATESQTAAHPFRTFGRGVLVFAATLGIIIVAALTVVGLFAIPILLVAIVLACSFAYVAGCYLMAIRLFMPFVALDSVHRRLAVLVFALILATMIGLIPFLGWLVTLALVCFGFGAVVGNRMSPAGNNASGNAAAMGPVQPAMP